LGALLVVNALGCPEEGRKKGGKGKRKESRGNSEWVPRDTEADEVGFVLRCVG
jgi:hypothetical protein